MMTVPDSTMESNATVSSTSDSTIIEHIFTSSHPLPTAQSVTTTSPETQNPTTIKTAVFPTELPTTTNSAIVSVTLPTSTGSKANGTAAPKMSKDSLDPYHESTVPEDDGIAAQSVIPTTPEANIPQL